MHIILLFTYGYSLKMWEQSGSLKRELLFYKTLCEKSNTKITFVTFGDETDIDYTNEFEVIPIYKFIKKRNSKILNYIQSFYYPFIIKKQLSDFDIIKQNQLLGSWIAIILKIITKKPLFVRTGYDMYKFSIDEKKSLLIKYLYKLLTKITLMRSDLYTISSQNDLEFLLSKFNKNILKNIKIRPNWVKLSENIIINSRKKYSILNVGRLEYQKNQIEIIKAISGTNFNLTIYGEGSMKSILLNEAKNNGISLTINDIIQNEKLIEIYKDFKYFILSSIFEGNPKVLLEAMSAGCVVIARDIPNNKEIIENGINGFLYKNQNELTYILQNINNDNEKLINISANARKNTNKNFSLESSINLELEDFNYLKV